MSTQELFQTWVEDVIQGINDVAKVTKAFQDASEACQQYDGSPTWDYFNEAAKTARVGCPTEQKRLLEETQMNTQEKASCERVEVAIQEILDEERVRKAFQDACDVHEACQRYNGNPVWDYFNEAAKAVYDCLEKIRAQGRG